MCTLSQRKFRLRLPFRILGLSIEVLHARLKMGQIVNILFSVFRLARLFFSGPIHWDQSNYLDMVHP